MLIGTRLNYGLYFGRPGLFSRDQQWIQIDIEPTEIGRNRSIDIGIVGDAKAVLGQMIEEARDRCQSRRESPWVKECRAYLQGRQEQLEAEMNSDSIPIHPARLCKEIRDFVDRDAIIAMDGGDTTVWGAAVLRSYKPGHWLDNGPTGCLGVGVPFAIAAKAARPPIHRPSYSTVMAPLGSTGWNSIPCSGITFPSSALSVTTRPGA